MNQITLTVLGCGSSSGTPMIGCDCAVCQSRQPENHRSRCSAWIQIQDQHWVIDTGTDFRMQALKFRIPRLDAVLYTHPHADHLNGIDDLRAYCFRQKQVIDVYGNAQTISNMQQRFAYAFNPPCHHWNSPVLKAHVLSDENLYTAENPSVSETVAKTYQQWQTCFSQNAFSDISGSLNDIHGIPVISADLRHGRHFQSRIYRIGNIAWLTDICEIHPQAFPLLENLDYLLIDCLMDKKFPNHLSVEEAFDFAKKINAKQTYLIHMTHHLEYQELKNRCPENIAPAFDGLTITSCF